LGRQRWVVERSFAWLHAFKRLRTRYERRGDIHLGLLQLACALICYRQLAVVLKRLLRDNPLTATV
jgi:transposase